MTEELQRALGQLRKAVEFADKVKADTTTDAYATGAARDAREWIDEAARAVVAAAPREAGE